MNRADSPSGLTHAFSKHRQGGYLLLAMSLGLIVLSLFGLAALEIGQGEAQHRQANATATNARYAAQAGVAKARWQLAQTGVCNGYASVASTRIDEFDVVATVSPADGSPVSIVASAENAQGVAIELSRQQVPVMREPEVVVIAPGEALEDTFVNGNQEPDNFGTRKHINVGSASPKHGLVHFDLLELPRGVTVLDATLRLNYVDNEGIATGQGVSLYAMQKPWLEAEATWEEGAIGEPWSWPDAFMSSDRIDWLDLSAASFGLVNFDVTRLVRAWASDEVENLGLVLVADSGVINARFHSGDENNVDRQPQLRVRYACECGVICAVSGESFNVLMFVAKSNNPDPEDDRRIELLESWGHRVAVIDDNASTSDIADGAAEASVTYVSSTVDASRLLGELADLPVGMVSEQAELLLELGFASAFAESSLSGVNVIDNSHYITSGYAVNDFVQLTDTNENYHFLGGSIAADAQQLAEEPGGSSQPSLATLEAGDLRQDAAPSIARRVNLPWAGTEDKFDMRELTTQGQTILRRSLEWAAASAVFHSGYHDSFMYRTCGIATDYFGSVGELDWSTTGWIENLDDDFSCSGAVRLAIDPDIPDEGDNRLLFEGDAEISRELDLSGYANAYLRFNLRRSGTTLPTEELRVYGSTDGSLYELIDVIAGVPEDVAYGPYVGNLTAYISPATHIKLETTGLTGAAKFYIDDVSVSDNPP